MSPRPLEARACAVQARLSVTLDVTLDVAQRRESPFRGLQHLGLAGVLVREMPHLLTSREHGLVDEWRATTETRKIAYRLDPHAAVIRAPARRTGHRGVGDPVAHRRPGRHGQVGLSAEDGYRACLQMLRVVAGAPP